MTAIRFSLSVHSIETAQTRLEFVGAFIVYMSTVSNVKITFGWVQFVSRKSRVYTYVNVYGRTIHIIKQDFMNLNEGKSSLEKRGFDVRKIYSVKDFK